jgi:hypothetical protein
VGGLTDTSAIERLIDRRRVGAELPATTLDAELNAIFGKAA